MQLRLPRLFEVAKYKIENFQTEGECSGDIKTTE